MRYIKYVLILFISIFIFDIHIMAYTEYKVGDEVTYNEIKYYVIKDSSTKESSVTMLKAEPLTVSEINEYGTGHVNRYTDSSVGTASNQNGYGSMVFYSSETCGYVNNNWVETGCTTSYESSDIKYVVDAWAAAKAPAASEARLITFEELTENLGFEYQQVNPTSQGYKYTENTQNWVYSEMYWYWTSSRYNDSSSYVWYVHTYGDLSYYSVYHSVGYGAVRPVIVLSKTVLGDKDESIIDDDTDKEDNKYSKVDSSNNTSQIKSTVKVANTYMRNSIITIIIGFIIASASIFILYKLRNKAK